MTNPIRSTTVLTLVGLLALLAMAPTFAPMVGASQPPISFSFNLAGPSVAYSPMGTPGFGGLTDYVTGSGSFTCTAYYYSEDSILHCTEGTVSGSGSYWLTAPDGTVVDRGTWVKTSFISFTGYGGPSPGKQGGFLEANAAITSNTLGSLGEMYSSLSCTINAPAGSPPAGHIAGYMVDGQVVGFTVPISGIIDFHLNN